MQSKEPASLLYLQRISLYSFPYYVTRDECPQNTDLGHRERCFVNTPIVQMAPVLNIIKRNERKDGDKTNLQVVFRALAISLYLNQLVRHQVDIDKERMLCKNETIPVTSSSHLAPMTSHRLEWENVVIYILCTHRHILHCLSVYF